MLLTNFVPASWKSVLGRWRLNDGVMKKYCGVLSKSMSFNGIGPYVILNRAADNRQPVSIYAIRYFFITPSQSQTNLYSQSTNNYVTIIVSRNVNPIYLAFPVCPLIINIYFLSLIHFLRTKIGAQLLMAQSVIFLLFEECLSIADNSSSPMIGAIGSMGPLHPAIQYQMDVHYLLYQNDATLFGCRSRGLVTSVAS